MCLLATNNNDEHFNSVFKGCGLDIPGTWTRAGGPGVGRGAFGASSGNFLKVGVKQGVDDSAPAPSSSGPMPAEHFMKEDAVQEQYGSSQTHLRSYVQAKVP
mmetsp:Transcript_2268/g.5111  ORF Transcript_2268/g.5111 Transcript_2268/m.5111 type:complete len:102 (+) Transcript_2268:47-352(+)